MTIPQSTQWARDNRERNRANNNALRSRKREHVNQQRREWRAANNEAVQREREANREAAKTRYKELYAKNRAILDAAKSVPCMDCGGSFDPICMDFDHRPGEEKKYQVSTLVGRARTELMLAEMSKCDVICSNCHRIRTRNRGQWIGRPR